MDIRPITEDYAVSPQIALEDIPAIMAAGYTTVICNRPDGEIPPQIQASAMREAAEAAGLAFVENPIHPGGFGEQTVAVHASALDEATGPVLAYCASGTRSTFIWALTQAGARPTDEIITAGAAQGYDLGGLRGMIEMLAQAKSS